MTTHLMLSVEGVGHGTLCSCGRSGLHSHAWCPWM